MRLFRSVALVLLASTPLVSEAALMSVDPDDYASGTDLSSVSSAVAITTADGDAVYASPVFPAFGHVQPAGLVTTGPLGDLVFSAEADANSEWESLFFSIPPGDSYNPLSWAGHLALMFTFTDPVDYVSLLAAEVTADGFTDPVRWWIYDSADQLIQTNYIDGAANLVTYLGTALGPNPEPVPAYPVWRGEFSNPDIHRVIVYGESEFTTLDHLKFNTVEVPEPGTAGLLLGAILMGAAARRRKQLSR